MKTKILFGLLISLMLFSAIALAGMMPQPISGQVKIGEYPSPVGLKVIQKNLKNGIEASNEVDKNGYYIVDWANYAYSEGDKIEITLNLCKEKASCKKTIVMRDGVPTTVDFSIPISETEIIKTIENQIYTYVCWDGSKVTKSSQCKIQPVKEIVKEVKTITCEDGTTVTDKAKCPGRSILWKIISAALAIFCAVAMGLFFTNRKKYKWIPGMIGIIKKYNSEADTLMKQGKKKEAEKKRQTALKTMNTITKKYLGK